MHPDTLDAEINALLDDLFGDFRIGENKNSLRLLGDRFQVRVARIAFKSRQARVDCADGISRRLEPVVGSVAARLAFV